MTDDELRDYNKGPGAPLTREEADFAWAAHDRDALARVQRFVGGFSAEMREKGIHLGMGSPPVCVTCDHPWPCPQSKKPKP